MWSQDLHPLIVPGIFKHCSPTALTALETCQDNMASRQTLQSLQSLQSSTEDGKFPIGYKEEIEKELGEMVCQGIIPKQTEPTPWVSSLTYPKKANGKLRICLDPKDLNKVIIWENHKAPTLEEIAHVLTGTTRFSKVDGNKAFFGMHLTEEASLLTTFNTHLARYRFLHVPFGLKIAKISFK